MKLQSELASRDAEVARNCNSPFLERYLNGKVNVLVDLDLLFFEWRTSEDIAYKQNLDHMDYDTDYF